jgi:predicted lysophospholipase L1 biosynthesis ABC-type transport system permease subunit
MLVWVGALTSLLVAVLCGLAVGPTPVAPLGVLTSLLSHLGIGHSSLSSFDQTVVWQLRGPRMVLGLLAGAVGSILSVGATWGMAHWVFHIEMLFPIRPVFVTVLCVVALTVGMGLLGARGLARHSPLEVLRSEA